MQKIILMKERTTPNLHDPYTLGCTCATVVKTIRSNKVIWSKLFKIYRSSDQRLQLIFVKLELLVIVD